MRARGGAVGLGPGWRLRIQLSEQKPTSHPTHRSEINNQKNYTSLGLFTDSIGLQLFSQYELVSTHLYCTTYIVRGLFHQSVSCHTHRVKASAEKRQLGCEQELNDCSCSWIWQIYRGFGSTSCCLYKRLKSNNFITSTVDMLFIMWLSNFFSPRWCWLYWRRLSQFIRLAASNASFTYANQLWCVKLEGFPSNLEPLVRSAADVRRYGLTPTLCSNFLRCWGFHEGQPRHSTAHTETHFFMDLAVHQGADMVKQNMRPKCCHKVGHISLSKTLRVKQSELRSLAELFRAIFLSAWHFKVGISPSGR